MQALRVPVHLWGVARGACSGERAIITGPGEALTWDDEAAGITGGNRVSAK
jgi:hypothetical protein